MHHRQEDISSISNRLQQSSQDKVENLFTAVKQLVDTEIELIKAIENCTDSRRGGERTETMSNAVKKRGKKSGKPSTVRPSAALLEAKREAVCRARNEKPKDIIIHDIYRKALDSYGVTRGATGIVFDRSMEDHKCLWDPNYPECPARFTEVLRRCEELNLISRCKMIQPRPCTDDDILMKHSQKQLDILKSTDLCTDVEKLEKLSSKYDSIFVHPSTYKLSLLSVGSTINLVESICKGDVQNGMAIIRPPGHHAMKSEYCGYCFFNNVAIATEKVLREGLANRILIVDWDVHHGQATQQMFYDNPQVVYFSIHRYEYGEFWPNLKESDYHYVGEGLGEGYNFNIPLNKTGMTNADYISIFQQVLLPMAYEFQPDLVIVSAGYDAALGCPEGEMEITPACYAHLLSSLLSLACGKVAVVLEGGYCLKSLAEGAALTLRTLLGDPCPMLQPLELPSISIRDTILNAIYAHRQYWKCYQYHDQYDLNEITKTKEQSDNRHVPVIIYKGEVLKTDTYETRNCYPKPSNEVYQELDKKLNTLISITNLSKAPNKVCIVYDDRMLKHCDPSDNTHPEKPNRIYSIYKKHEENDLLRRCHTLQGRAATQEELLLVHSMDYIESVKKTEHMKPQELRKQASEYNSIYLHNETWSSARISAGSLLQVVDSVLNNESQSGIGIVRPPGHHADDDMACGFCIFNNIAIAAKYAIECHSINRVLIVDWDVHHGNGTQSIFENDPRVLYISIHRYDNGSFFPNSKEANYTFVGTGAGEGYTVNIPWNKKGMSDVEYIAAFQRVVMPIAYRFNPELVLVSAGFDACIGDPLGGCLVTPEMYGHMTHWLSSLANGRIILALEGGYNVNSISHAMCACTKALLGDPLPMLDVDRAPCTSAINSINNTIKVQKSYWHNLMFDLALPKTRVSSLKMKTDTKVIDKANKYGESKIALEGIETEKFELNISIDKSRLNSVTDEEISKLQNEIENIKIRKLNVDDTKNEISAADLLTNEIESCAKKSVNSDEQSKNSKSVPESDRPGTSSGTSTAQAQGSSTTATTLSDYLADNLQALVAEEMFAVVPLRECPHLDTVEEVPEAGIDVDFPCTECYSTAENWICLKCYTVHCARNINGHGLQHAQETEHPMTLSFSDLSVWCYGCEAYIDNPRLYAARNAAHRSKFNEELPWTYDESSPIVNQR